MYKHDWVKNTRNGLETLARFGLDSEMENVKYWKKDEERICSMCGKEAEDIQHVLEKCKKTGDLKINWINQLNEGRRTIARLKRIKRIRDKEKRE